MLDEFRLMQSFPWWPERSLLLPPKQAFLSNFLFFAILVSWCVKKMIKFTWWVILKKVKFARLSETTSLRYKLLLHAILYTVVHFDGHFFLEWHVSVLVCRKETWHIMTSLLLYPGLSQLLLVLSALLWLERFNLSVLSLRIRKAAAFFGTAEKRSVKFLFSFRIVRTGCRRNSRWGYFFNSLLWTKSQYISQEWSLELHSKIIMVCVHKWQ